MAIGSNGEPSSEFRARKKNDIGRTALVGGAADDPAVEVPGIEPGSFGVSSGLLRAQLTVPLLGPTNHVSKLV